jgi:NAD+ dependent glucose-6-phosphate dehydrogenase
MARKVLITGAAGNIGGKLAAHFKETGTYDLVLLDQHAGGGIVAADFGVYDEAWARHFAGVDTVIHLAGNPRGTASWASAQRNNIWGTQHVLRASREAQVRRVVFASTNQVMLGYRFREEVTMVTTDLPPLPLSPYGVSKLFCEELGRGFSEETGISFIALRIGYFQRGENRPGPHMGIGLWGQSMWLSNRDMNHAMERAVEAEDVPFAILNLESDNPGMRWDIELTRKTIGYRPQDGHPPVMLPANLAEDEKARAVRLPPGTWFDEHFHVVEA